jgi:hypothetical protein
LNDGGRKERSVEELSKLASRMWRSYKKDREGYVRKVRRGEVCGETGEVLEVGEEARRGG